MKELWRKTAKLFVNYPILWLPYICAQLLDSSLDMLRRAAYIPIFRWLATSRSVLSGAPVQDYSSTAAAKIAWISGAMEWSLRYLTLCIYTIALVVTAALVAMIVRGEQPRLRAALAGLRKYPKRILGYSFKLFFLDLVVVTFVMLPAARLSEWVTHSTAMTGWSRAANFALMRGQGLVSLILFAWIITPITIRLLRVPGAQPPSADEKKLGRYFVILAGAGALALGATVPPLLFKLVTLPPIPEQVFASLVSPLWSFPFLLGDIAVALIAVGGDWNPGETYIERRWRELVRVLMPLHFDEREEH